MRLPTVATWRTPLAAALAVIAAGMLFGTTGTAQELGPDGSTPLGVGAVRIAVGAVVLWLVAIGGDRRSGRPRLGLVAVGAAGVAVYQPGFFTGTERLGVALGTIVALGSAPVFAGLIESAAGRPPGRSWAVASAIAIAGGALVVAGRQSGVELSALGLTGALAAGLGYACYAVATKRMILDGVDSTIASAWQFSIAAVMLAPLMAVEPTAWLASASGLAMALHLGVLATGLAYVLYGWGLRLVDTSTATSLTLVEPVTAALLAVVVLDERLIWYGWLGVALVLAGLAALGGGTRRHAATPTEPALS